MADILGYARVSTTDQDLDGQRHRLTDAGAIRVFDDVISGRTFERPGLITLLDYARTGDVLCVVRLDLDSLHHRRHRPAWQQFYDLLLQAVQSILAVADGGKVLLDEDVMGGVVEFKAANPLDVHLCPMGFTLVDAPVPEQKALQMLAIFFDHLHGRDAGAHQIANRLMSFVGHPDQRQVAGAVQPGQFQSIVAVILDANALLGWGMRRRDDGALVPQPGELALKAISAGTSLVAEIQLAVVAGELLDQLQHGCRLVGDLAIVANLALAAVLGNGDRDRFFVRVKSDECCIIIHGLPPMIESLRQTIRRNTRVSQPR
jgi:Resolvase, N terminal domain